MTWLDQYKEKIAAPAIGTDEWFECIPGQHRHEATILVKAKTPVVVVPTQSGWKIVFDETEFIAGAFVDKSIADQFAAAWNRGA